MSPLNSWELFLLYSPYNFCAANLSLLPFFCFILLTLSLHLLQQKMYGMLFCKPVVVLPCHCALDKDKLGLYGLLALSSI